MSSSSTPLRLKVKPQSRQTSLTQLEDGTWLAQVKAPPIDGAANEAVIALVAKHFGIPKSKVKLTHGTGSRYKKLELLD